MYNVYKLFFIDFKPVKNAMELYFIINFLFLIRLSNTYLIIYIKYCHFRIYIGKDYSHQPHHENIFDLILLHTHFILKCI